MALLRRGHTLSANASGAAGDSGSFNHSAPAVPPLPAATREPVRWPLGIQQVKDRGELIVAIVNVQRYPFFCDTLDGLAGDDRARLLDLSERRALGRQRQRPYRFRRRGLAS